MNLQLTFGRAPARTAPVTPPTGAVRPLRTAALCAAGLALASCATQPAYRAPDLALAPAWSNMAPDPTSAPGVSPPALTAAWWTQLNDPAVDALAQAALRDNPTLAQALAAVDAARATARLNTAGRLPQVAASGSAAKGQVLNALPGARSLVLQESSQTVGPTLSWEIDLWGRLAQSERAARARLDARSADAEEARLALVSQIADGVLALRACNYALAVRDRDLRSREVDLDLTVRRRAVGNAAPVEEAAATTNLANARTARISQEEQCARQVDALFALSGLGAAEVRRLVPAAATGAAETDLLADAPVEASIPTPPPIQLAVPATVLLHHPAVVSADREAAARWSEIAVARAERLPRIDLQAALAGNWIQAAGLSAAFETWSAGGNLSGPVFDGGAGSARVAGSQALYRQAVASLRATVRATAQDVEDALAGQESAAQRLQTTRLAVEAGRKVLQAKEAQWRAGAVSLFELEQARRDFNTAQEDAVSAARDQAQAWVDLVRASGGSPEGPARTAQSSNPLSGKSPG